MTGIWMMEIIVVVIILLIDPVIPIRSIWEGYHHSILVTVIIILLLATIIIHRLKIMDRLVPLLILTHHLKRNNVVQIIQMQIRNHVLPRSHHAVRRCIRTMLV